MIYYKNQDEIEKIRRSCLIVCEALAKVAGIIAPGVTGLDIDRAAEALIRSFGAQPGFKGYRGFPATLCISRNECVVHGIPNNEPFVEGDIVSVDCGALLDGFYGDAAYTFALGDVADETMELLRVTKTSLYRAIDQAVEGKRLGDIGNAVQDLCEKKYSYSVVRELVGHGIGQNLHEGPEVPNYGKRGRGTKLTYGLVLAIEPMVNLGRKEVVQGEDGWTIRTKDFKPSAHYEHTVAIGLDKADILSDHSMLEECIKNNPHVQEISIKN